MAIFWMATADMKTMSVWDAHNGATIETGTKRSGTASFKHGNGQWVGKYFPASNEIWGQFAVRTEGGAWSSNLTILQLNSGATVLLTLALQVPISGAYPAQRNLRAYTGNKSALLGVPGTAQISNATFNVIEFYIKLADDGVFRVWVDGILDIDFTGDTKPGAETTFDAIYFGVGSSTATLYTDDYILADADQRFYGAYVGLTSPSEAGAHAEFTPSSGANYQCVDELPPVSTDFVLGSTNGLIDTYTFEDLPAIANNILAVQMMLNLVSIQGAVSITNIQPVYRIGGNDRLGTTIPVSFGSQYLRHIQILSPDSGVPWTLAEINAMECGFKVLT